MRPRAQTVPLHTVVHLCAAVLAAGSLGLGACGVGAFMDDQINEMLGVDGVEEAAVYMLAVGHAA